MKKVAAVCLLALGLTACERDATIASSNLAKAAEMFELDRRIVFYNGISGEYMLSIEGRCSIEDFGHKLAVTCKNGPKEYKKHHLGLSDNVTYFSEQLGYADVSVYHHKVIFKPQSILPNIEFSGSTEALTELVE